MACSQTIKGYIRGCETSMGGVKEIYLANWTKDTFAVATSQTSGDTVTIASGATSVDWYKYDIRKNTANFTSTLNIDDANGVNYISTELNLVFTKMETLKRMEMAALVLGDFMAIVVDANGIAWALGKDAPMIATAGTGETGTAKSDGNKYNLTLTDESLYWPYEFSGTLPTPANATGNIS